LCELVDRGHDVRVFEPADGWSRTNLLRDHGRRAIEDFERRFPELKPTLYTSDADPEEMLERADVVVVHEWTDPKLVAAIGRLRQRRSFVLLFHDTHHRAASDPTAMRAIDLSGYDGVLAFGRSLADIYDQWGWGKRAYVWHEAADTRWFQALPPAGSRQGLVWIGNWGDGERAQELGDFLLRPGRASGLSLDIYGVRYPDEARRAIERHGGHYRGWLPNARAPETFSRHLATVHVPRRFYTRILPGIPTIRVFEALACGIPLVCAPWDDCENLFSPGDDYLVARSETEMTRHLKTLAADEPLRRSLAAHGRATIARRHTCAHRVDELLAIVKTIRTLPEKGAA
jgi:spore maturation protein CgeB